VSQACKTCANTIECNQKPSIEQELCKIEIIKGGYGNWINKNESHQTNLSYGKKERKCIK
jgi:hypothetical protein